MQVGIPEENVCAEVLPSHKKDNVTSFQNRNVKVNLIFLYNKMLIFTENVQFLFT